MGDIFDSRHYRILKYSLQSIGHWPFQSSKEKLFFRSLTLFIISTIVIPKTIKLIELLNDFDLVVECLLILGCYMLGLIKFFNWIIMEDHMKHLLLVVEKDWNDLKLVSERQILHHHSNRARRWNIFYAVGLYSSLLAYFSSPAVPKILDIIKPLNESRPRVFLYQTEFFIDQDKYYIHLLIHAYITVPVGLSYVVFFDNLFATLITHACGMFQILQSQLETIHVNYTMQNLHVNNFQITMNCIKRCSDLQTWILMFVTNLESCYSIALLIIVGVNMLLIVFAGVTVVIKISSLDEMIRIIFISLAALSHLFWISWLGHILIVKSEKVFISTYQSEWYRLPPRLQLMIIPIMMRSLKPCEITAGKIYVMSMQSFGTALKTMMSFFTVLNSMR